MLYRSTKSSPTTFSCDIRALRFSSRACRSLLALRFSSLALCAKSTVRFKRLPHFTKASLFHSGGCPIYASIWIAAVFLLTSLVGLLLLAVWPKRATLMMDIILNAISLGLAVFLFILTAALLANVDDPNGAFACANYKCDFPNAFRWRHKSPHCKHSSGYVLTAIAPHSCAW